MSLLPFKLKTPSWVLLFLCFTTRFAENIGKLHVENLKVPDPFILGKASDLHCNYSWDGPQHHGRNIYSIKWYKENQEFFRYIPSEDPSKVSFNKAGIFVDESQSSAHTVHLRTAQWTTAGNYRCEVTAEDFETASKSVYAEVVAVPRHNPYIEGQKARYSPGELVDLNCTSNSSDPVADLYWYINSELASQDMLVKHPRIREPSNLLTTVLGLQFRIGSKHIKAGTVKVKCTAMLLTVYLKSNEISFEVKRPQRAPALESREKDGKTLISTTGNAKSFEEVVGQQNKRQPVMAEAENVNEGPFFGFGASGGEKNVAACLSMIIMLTWILFC